MNLFVSNINEATKSESLHELFAQYGQVTSAKIINDRVTGESRGFGFVEMANDTEAQDAIEKLANTTFEGRSIGVAVARPKK